jgi:hypothetical protein
LLEIMQRDPYPAVRRFAARALGHLLPERARAFAAFVPETAPDARGAAVAALRAALPFPAAALAEGANLWRAPPAALQAIEIGE